MDGQRFDELARLIGSGTSRRSALKLIGVTIGAALASRSASAQTCAGPGEECVHYSDCCAGYECNPDGLCEPWCLPLGEPCVTSADCCRQLDHNCVANVCVEENTCSPWGESCVTDDDCCDNDDSSCIAGVCGERCLTEGGTPCYGSGAYLCCAGLECVDDHCIDVTCHPLGEACADRNQCCDAASCIDGTCEYPRRDGESCSGNYQCDSEVCYDGICSSCEPAGLETYCNSADDCCSGTCMYAEINQCWPCRASGKPCESGSSCCSGECQGGICTPYPCMDYEPCAVEQTCVNDLCYPNSWICSSDADCTDGQTCSDRICQAIACGAAGGTCSTDPECCDGLTCISGTCGTPDDGNEPPESPVDGPDELVTTLPSTGSGQPGGDTNAQLGASLAAGLAGLLAWKRQRGPAGQMDSREYGERL